MEEFRPSNFRSSVGDRRLEIVSGRGYNSSQIYASNGRALSPDLPPIPSAASKPSQQATPSSSSSAKPWGSFNDPEMKRRKRIAKYKVYTLEGKVKASIRSGLRWIKNKCSEIIHGY